VTERFVVSSAWPLAYLSGSPTCVSCCRTGSFVIFPSFGCLVKRCPPLFQLAPALADLRPVTSTVFFDGPQEHQLLALDNSLSDNPQVRNLTVGKAGVSSDASLLKQHVSWIGSQLTSCGLVDRCSSYVQCAQSVSCQR